MYQIELTTLGSGQAEGRYTITLEQVQYKTFRVPRGARFLYQ